MSESYNESVRFQGTLDEVFPRGAAITVINLRGSSVIPTGLEISVARLFCSASVMVDGAWIHEIRLDPSYDEDRAPWLTIPIWDIFPHATVEDLWESEIYNPLDQNDEQTQILRMHSKPAGSRRIPTGAREFLSGVWETELFPEGLEEMAQ